MEQSGIYTVADSALMTSLVMGRTDFPVMIMIVVHHNYRLQH